MNHLKQTLLEVNNIFFYRMLENKLTDCKTILDVGCGHSSAVGMIHRNFKSEGIDIFKKTLNESKKRKLHDSYRLGDITKLTKIYKKNSFDACVAIDVIEHFTKKEALKLIGDMESIAKKKVILLTPNGFYEQDDYDGNPYQQHKSGWRTDELARLGYKVFGLRGLQVLRDDHASIRFKPWIFWGFCSFISEILCYPFPSISFDLFAVKNK